MSAWHTNEKKESEENANERRNNYSASKTGNENLRFAMPEHNDIVQRDKDDLYSIWLFVWFKLLRFGSCDPRLGKRAIESK